MISDRAVEAIQASVATSVMEINGESFLTRPVHRIPTDPEPATLELSTLAGLVAWLKDFPDRVAKEGIAGIHIKEPHQVQIIGSLNDKAQRFTFVSAEVGAQRSFTYGVWYGQEDFLVRLKCAFVDDGNSKAVARIAGNVVGKDEITSEDDGFSQTVGVKKGISAVEKVEIPNPVILAPYRTFTEIEQPSSKFLFRFRRGGGNEPQFALFSVDDNRWMEAAKASIQDYLNEHQGDAKLPVIV